MKNVAYVKDTLIILCILVYFSWLLRLILSNALPVKFNIDHLAFDSLDLGLNLTESGKTKLQSIAIFINDIKRTLPVDDAYKIEYLDISIVNDNMLGVYKPNPFSEHTLLSIGKDLLETSIFSIDELKAGVSHEVGHILENHLSINTLIIRLLHEYSQIPLTPFFLIRNTIAGHRQEMELAADRKSVEFNIDYRLLISFLRKLEYGNLFLLQNQNIFLKFISKLIQPCESEQSSSHPSIKVREKLLTAYVNSNLFKQKKANIQIDKANAVNNPIDLSNQVLEI